jgi:hypothetical protein
VLDAHASLQLVHILAACVDIHRAEVHEALSESKDAAIII